MTGQRLTEEQRADALSIWGYHQLGHEVRSCSVGVGLGSHDLGVAAYASELYLAGLFPVLVFTGGNSPSTVSRFPRGEAVEYAEHAVRLGVPESAILVEPLAGNTGQNIEFSRGVLAEVGVEVDSLLLISKPYMERRAFATARKVWPEVELVCASEPLSFDEYVRSIGDEKLVIDMLVGDLQRVVEYPALGFSVAQDVPDEVRAACRRLVTGGFDGHLVPSSERG
ncbi:YdcF family protein [Actinomadura meridiana]|uniref:YdcF family protein n=1 Tax=Actinomadura meridiana TaxID=559626 RepID=A0ABP8BRE1_9ACTN